MLADDELRQALATRLPDLRPAVEGVVERLLARADSVVRRRRTAYVAGLVAAAIVVAGLVLGHAWHRNADGPEPVDDTPRSARPQEHGKEPDVAHIIQRVSIPALALALVSVVHAQPYRVTSLVSDGSVPAAHTDPALVNSWGIAFNPAGVVWVADNATGLSTLYDGHGVPQSLIVSIPSVPGSTEPGAPTGIVFSGGDDFVISNSTASGAARSRHNQS